MFNINKLIYNELKLKYCVKPYKIWVKNFDVIKLGYNIILAKVKKVQIFKQYTV